MKKIQNFENFSNSLNELSTELVNKAANVAKGGNEGDVLDNEKKSRQHNQFKRYFNPEAKEKLKVLGFTVDKSDVGNVSLRIAAPSIGQVIINVSPEEYRLSVEPGQLGSSLLRKIQRAIKIVQNELKASNEL